MLPGHSPGCPCCDQGDAQSPQASQAIVNLIFDTKLSNPPTLKEMLALLTAAEKLGYDRAQQEIVRS